MQNKCSNYYINKKEIELQTHRYRMITSERKSRKVDIRELSKTGRNHNTALLWNSNHQKTSSQFDMTQRYAHSTH